MDLREFAEQVLFATTLEEKLRCPEAIEDAQPGKSLGSAPPMPGRPIGLAFKPSGSGKSDFPRLHRLDQEAERGRLLHFFANHELLATELMALVLLRFPEAPSAFRKGVLETLKDEQIHTRLYLDRMRECGTEFGSIPVSGYFWRAVSPMETPMDYVAGLSLTFEQANLDFCRHFAREFQSVGDTETARLLDTIYRDEIAHVAHGLKWFRRWKNPDQTDWEAFCQQLKYPLSPNRAKGAPLNVEGRQAAGMEPDFIENLAVFSQSKGRTPRVYVFNPFTEEHIAKGARFTPVRAQSILARDLENLPQFLCRQDDIVLVNNLPSAGFLNSIQQAGFPLPEFAQVQGCAEPSSPLALRKLGGLRPWAWGPDSLKLFGPLASNLTDDNTLRLPAYHEGIAALYSKTWSAAFFRRLLKTMEAPPWLCTEQEAGIVADTMDEALKAIASIRGRGHHRVVVKESFGLAGHNMIRLWEPELLTTHRAWIERGLGNGHPLVIEPWLDRVLDFSVQLEMEPCGLKRVGFTGLRNDLRGQFQANWAEPNHEKCVPNQVLKLLRAPSIDPGNIHIFYKQVVSFLEVEFRSAGFLGPVGIDAFVYRTPLGDCRLKPVVEINPRYTMGRLTLELMKQVCPGSTGVFKLTSRAALRSEGFESFVVFAKNAAERFPITFAGHPRPRLSEGLVVLNDPTRAEGFLATFRVGKGPGSGHDVERWI